MPMPFHRGTRLSHSPLPRRGLAFRHLAGAVLLLATLATAQRTWIVDASGGPGTTHRDIPAAVTAARDGDTIRVRRGVYSPFVLRKALTVLGDPGAQVKATSSRGPSAVQILGIGAGKRVVVEGLTVVGPLSTGAFYGVLVSSCVGAVHLANLTLPKTENFLATARGIAVRSCKQVTIGQSRIEGKNAVDVGSASQVALQACRLTGMDARSGLGGIPLPSTPGLIVSGKSTVTLAQCSASGGKGRFQPLRVRDSSPAVVVTDSSLTLAGDAIDAYAAGAKHSFQTTPSPAISTTKASVWIARAIRLLPNSGAPKISGTPRTRVGDPVSLRALDAPPGGLVKLTAISGRGEKVYLLIALPGSPTTTPWGAFWLDPGSLALLASTTQGATGHWDVAVPVPAFPALRGWAIGFQALSGIKGSRTAPLRLSTPAVAILD